MASLHMDQCGEYSQPNGFLGEPDATARIGDEYQVEIPPVIGESNISCSLDLMKSENSVHCLPNFAIGLPIPVSLVHLKRGMSCKDAVKSETNPKNEKIETSNYLLNDLGKPKEELQNDQCDRLVPGLSNEHWSDNEKASFLLALYIFERNFVEVRRFVKTKGMGAILFYYYGVFYRSKEYHRWSKGRKTKSKKYVYGPKIFSGMRQQELLSRVLPTLSEDCRDDLFEVSKKFGDEKISLSDYVSSFKALVGMDTFVKAVGIGNRKKDLTRMVLDSSRSNQVNPMHVEIPIGKACSTLTASEIIKILSGNYRLSKARSNDLFWDAVWPRLLARGWHSEQPEDQGFFPGFNNSLVYLVPGATKFSRSDMVKGDHYFDSIPEILNKVAKDPWLIELDSVEVESEKNKKDSISISGRKLAQDGDESHSKQRHCYLQPRTSNRDTDDMEITVVDTSLVGGKVRELRGLSAEDVNAVTSQGDMSNISVGNLKRKKALHDKKLPKKVPESQLRTKMKHAEMKSAEVAAPISQRFRRLTASTQDNQKFNNDGLSFHGSPDKLASGTCSYPGKLSPPSSSKGNPNENVEHASGSSLETGRLWIDLNIPQVSPESENGAISTQLTEEQDNQTSDANKVRSKRKSSVEPRRQSTRYRPPTTKALEAVANGFLTVPRRRKAKDKGSE